MKRIKRLGMIAIVIMLTCFVTFAQAVPEFNTLTQVQPYDYAKSGEIVKSEDMGAEMVTIKIAATSDIHGRLYPWDYAIDAMDSDAGYSLTYGIIQEIRQDYPDLLLIDIGDIVQDNSSELFNDLDTHPMIQAMNTMKYDVWVPGNHEFNFGLDFLERNFDHFDGRVVCSNIIEKNTMDPFVLPCQIYVIHGVRVAVIGGIAPHVPLWEGSAPEHFQGLDFTNPIQAVKNTVDSIDGQYDVLVAAMHMSRHGEYEYANKGGVFNLAEEVPELDIIFAGHEHATYCDQVNDTWVLEPGKYGSQVATGEIHLAKKNGNWMIKEVMAENIDTKGRDTDPEIMEDYAWVDEKARMEANTVIGEITDAFLPEGVDYITGENNVTTMARAQVEDTAVVDLINTVQKYYAKADVSSAALFQSDSTLNKGDFKKKDVAFIYKYNNTLMGVNISGKNLLEYMEWSASFYNTAKPGDITVSFNPDIRGYNYDMFAGINYKIDVSKEPGHRIVEAKINGMSIDSMKTYKLALNNYRFGTLQSNGWITSDDIYYDSYQENQLTPEVRQLIIKYVNDKLNGKLSPVCDHNWMLIGMDKEFNNPKGLEKIRKGMISIPKSEDGRTYNVKAVNIADL